MAEVKVTITKITDTGGCPCFAEAEFTDRYGEKHVFRDKLPIFARDDTDMTVPREGIIRCTVIAETDGFCVIDTEFPDDVEDSEGRYRFETDERLVVR
ncbi:hypothetical protein [uncultured Ruminococcus sp.]|uniref:hypothetical protein n=1 Tax=uncultured Ruminococcus sp. TaxID=165186 RepID=UPI000ED60C9B|nr:hypothetical protein [uncultured Ruminococcus sp.]HCJ41372.1 hypothetical protein [Ruminococcus sp.]